MNRIRLEGHACLILALLGAPAWAGDQDAIRTVSEGGRSPEAAEAAIDFDVRPGTLDQVLAHFGRQAGMQLVVDARLTAGLGSQGVRGRYPGAQALERLLEGTGLRAVSDGVGGYSLERAPGAVPRSDGGPGRSVGTVVRVDASRWPAAGSAPSYAAGAMTTATPLTLTDRQTPGTVSAITRAQMDDLAATRPADAFALAPGLTVSSISGPNREVFYARGFQFQTYSFDGHPARYTTSGGQVLLNELVIYERIELVRGAVGVTQGVGTPAGALNFIRKRPQAQFEATLRGMAGSWHNRGLEADLGGPLNASGSLRARLILHGREADGFQDLVSEGRRLAYLIAEADLDADTRLTAALTVQRNRNLTTYAGLPTARTGADLGLARSTFLGNRWNYWDEDNSSAYLGLERRLARGWRLAWSGNRIWAGQDRFVTGIHLHEGRYRQTGLASVDSNDRSSLDLHLSGPLSLFGREHDLVVGLAGRSAREDADVSGYWPPMILADNVDVQNWHHDAPRPGNPVQDFQTRSREHQHGAYASARLDVADRTRLILGLRLNWYRFNAQVRTLDHATGQWDATTDRYQLDRQPTHYVGLIRELGDALSVYASHADVFQPQSERNRSGHVIAPIVGRNLEVGLKADLNGGALRLNAALFRIDQRGKAMPDGPCASNPGLTCYRATGLARATGFDLELTGALSPSWQIAAGFTQHRLRALRDADPGAVGARLDTQLPERQFKFMTSYQRPGGRWRLGGSVRWQSAIHHRDTWEGFVYATRQRAYAVVDAMVGYQFNRHVDLQFRVSNLFDKVYLREINAQPVEWGGNTLYGTPRRLMLTASYRL